MCCEHACAVSMCVNSCCRILDDKEFYEKEEPFKLADLVQLSQLLNQIAFSLIWKVRTCICVHTYSTYIRMCVHVYIRTCVCTYMCTL